MMIGRKLTSGPGESTPTRLAPALLEHRDRDAERRADRQQEPERRLQRHQHRAEREQQQQERQPDHDEQVHRQRVGQLVRHIDADCRVAGHRDLASPVASGCTADRRFFTRSAVSSLAGPLFGITLHQPRRTVLTRRGRLRRDHVRQTLALPSTCCTSASDGRRVVALHNNHQRPVGARPERGGRQVVRDPLVASRPRPTRRPAARAACPAPGSPARPAR